MTDIDPLKNLALFRFKKTPNKYGVAFAVHQYEQTQFLVCHGEGEKEVKITSMQMEDMEFQHYSRWEQLMTDISFLTIAMQIAGTSDPATWPPNYKRPYFELTRV